MLWRSRGRCLRTHSGSLRRAKRRTRRLGADRGRRQGGSRRRRSHGHCGGRLGWFLGHECVLEAHRPVTATLSGPPRSLSKRFWRLWSHCLRRACHSLPPPHQGQDQQHQPSGCHKREIGVRQRAEVGLQHWLDQTGDGLSMAESSGERWYVRDHVAGQPRQVWLFVDQTATRIGVTNPETGPGTYFKAQPGEDIWDCIRRQTPWLNPGVTEGLFHPMALGPAEFYPRIARPIVLASEPSLWSPSVLTDKAYVAGARNQLTLLVRKLEVVCQTVQPSENTLKVYGNEIRNLLILAATEVEMHWRGILSANRLSASQFNRASCKIHRTRRIFPVFAGAERPALRPARA